MIAAPQIAAATSGDCTFEVDECGWSNVVSRERLDDIDWERTSGAALRSTAHDHTLGTEKGKEQEETSRTLTNYAVIIGTQYDYNL